MYRHIRDLREDFDLRQREVAEHLKCSQRSYSYYENGRTRIPTDVLIELSRFYGTSVDYLLDLTEEREPYPEREEEAESPLQATGGQACNVAEQQGS